MREPDFVDECYADKDLSLLKKLTLVIPTYNRNYYLSRCLWYHAHFPFGEIIVADSSPEEKKVVNRETVAKVREMFGANVRYLEYEPETEKYGGDIYRKWGDAVQHVETEYSIICIDKAFLIPVWLIAGIHYLGDHPDTVSITGDRYYLRTKRQKSSNPKYCVNIIKSENVLEELAEPQDRFSHAFNKSKPWSSNRLFSLNNSKTHKKLYNLLEIYSIKDIRYGELILGYAGNIYGKNHYIEGIEFIRDIIIISSTEINKRINNSESSDSRYPHINDLFVINDSFYENFVNCIYSELKMNTDTNKKNVIKLSMNDVLRYDNRISQSTYLLKRYNQLIHIWYNYIPYKIQICIRYLLSQILPYLPLPHVMFPINTNKDLVIIKKIVSSTHNLRRDDLTMIR